MNPKRREIIVALTTVVASGNQVVRAVAPLLRQELTTAGCREGAMRGPKPLVFPSPMSHTPATGSARSAGGTLLTSWVGSCNTTCP